VIAIGLVLREARAHKTDHRAASLVPVVHVANYGARGNGSTDDTRALGRALAAAARSPRGAIVSSAPGLTFLTSGLTVRGHGITVDLHGSTIKARPHASGPLITVLGAHATLTEATVDANRVAQEAVLWEGADGLMRGDHLVNGPYKGLVVLHSSLTATAVTASHFADVCFDVTSNRLITHNDSATYCGYAGFYFSPTSSNDVLDGVTSHNGIGADIKNPHGHIVSFRSTDDNKFGLVMDGHASYWTADYVNAANTGRTERIPQGTGVELIGASHNSFQTIISNLNPGYALAFAHRADDNRVAALSADNIGNWNANPGLLFDTGSSANRVKRAYIAGYSECLHIGETYPFTPANDNWVGTLTAVRCPYDAIRVDYGNRNHIDTAIVAGCGAITNSPHEPYLGTVDFARRTEDNAVSRLDEHPSDPGDPIPRYAVYFSARTRGNVVAGGRLRSWKVRPTRDDGHNTSRFDSAGNPAP
jgi:hypothetical protein